MGSQTLADELQLNKSGGSFSNPDDWKLLKVSFRTEQGHSLVLQADQEQSVLPVAIVDLHGGQLPWFSNAATAPHVLGLGMAFLRNGAFTVDVETNRAWSETMLPSG